MTRPRILFNAVAASFIMIATSAVPQSPQARLDAFRVPQGNVAEILRNAPELEPAGNFARKVTTRADQRMQTTGGDGSEAHILLSLSAPLTADQRLEFSRRGIEIIDRADTDVWIARIDADTADRISDVDGFAAADIVPLAAKLSPLISLEAPAEFQKREDGNLAFSFLFYKGVTADEAQRMTEAGQNVRVEEISVQNFDVLRTAIISMPPEVLAEVASQDIVQWVEPAPPPNADHNLLNTQPLSNVDDVQGPPYNLSGAGVTVGIWENGDTIRATHQDLTPRVTVQPGQTASQDGHALHVAGTVGSSGVNTPNAEGMAPAVNILSWDDNNGQANDDTTELTNASAGATPQIVASNHSYGAVLGWAGNAFLGGNQGQAVFGSYNNRSVNFDTIVNTNDVVILKSAGNDRNDGGATGNGTPGQPRDCTQGGFGVDADCLGPVASSKNVITVGAMNGNAVIANFSSFGPTDDGRIKPDIMAQGVGVLSLGDFGVPPGGGPATDDIAQTNNGTWTTGGTSMSTPALTGMVALMFEEFANQNLDASAAAVKAILLQTARDVNGPGQSTLGPDYATGYGIADIQAAIDLLRRPGGPGFAEGTMTATGAAGAWEFPFVVPAGQPEIHVTLAWSDPPGTPAGAGPELVNDLDLRLVPPAGGAGFTPWQLNPANPGQAAVRNGGDDTVNNVEQVSVLTPQAGTWIARVSAKPGSLALGSQPFAIAGPITPDTGPIAGPKANIMMVLDKSGSMILPAATAGLNKMQALQGAATAFVDYMELVGGHNLGLVAFDSAVAVTNPSFGLQTLNAGAATNARTAIGNLAPGGRTAIVAGVSAATGQLSGVNATNANDVVVLFSDGRHNEPVGSNVASIDGIMANDTRFFSIGFGTDVDSTVMPGVAANHDGVHLEEQNLFAGQLAKLFMVVGGLAADEAIIVDPDYDVPQGASAVQSVYASQEDRSLTFAVFWEDENSEIVLSLTGPNTRCRIPLRPHGGLDSRTGARHAIVRVELPYTCSSKPLFGTEMHRGNWSLSMRNAGNTRETVKVVVLGDSAIDFDLDVQAKGRKALISARVLKGDRLLRHGVRVVAHILTNAPSTGDSEKLDMIVADTPDFGGFTIPDSGGIVIVPGRFGATGSVGRLNTSVAANTEKTRADEEAARLIELERLNPSISKLLLERARRMRLPDNILNQLQGRFSAPSRAAKLELRDDGTNGDRRAGDGVFSAMIEVPKTGLYQVRAVAKQAGKGGVLTREALASFLAQ